MDPIEQSPEIINPASEAEARAAKWHTAMESNVPPFSGPDFMSDNTESPAEEALDSDEYDAGMADAAALVNYGLDAAAMRLGVETTIQRIKTFDASNSTDPIKDLYEHLGIGENTTREEVHDTAVVVKDDTDAMREEIGAPTQPPRTAAGAFKAIDDMKELILEVEGADPAYASLRTAAESAGMGYFEYAVGASEGRSLSDLLLALRDQKDQAESIIATSDSETFEDSETPENSENSAGSASSDNLDSPDDLNSPSDPDDPDTFQDPQESSDPRDVS